MAWPSLWLLTWAAWRVADVGASAAALAAVCSRACGAFETCVAYGGAEYCAPFCAPGRCNDATETCIVEGRACDRAPCLPVVVCESKSVQPTLQQQQMASANDDVSGGGTLCARQCPMVDAPVCGSNGVSYANQCFFDIAQCTTPSLALAYTRLCDADAAFNAQYNSAPMSTTPPSTSSPECDAIVCSTVVDPVCTTNGTMTNLCFLTKAKCNNSSIALIHRSACEDPGALVAACPAVCTQEYVPVCASNGVVYGNDCLFRQAKCERRAYGELQARDMSECEMQVGDSQGAAVDVAAWFMSTQ